MASSAHYPFITSKPAIRSIIEKGLEKYDTGLEKSFIQYIHKELLQKKIKFPLLEYAAKLMADKISAKEQPQIINAIVELNEIGSYVLAGMILQLQLEKGINKPIQQASGYIVFGDVWYVCDIVGERVMGHALLTEPEKTIPILRKLSKDNNKWLVRSVGVATHYATKKGLPKIYADEMFLLLFSLSHTTEFHTKTGVGWGAKTIAKFHPDIISKYRSKIDESKTVRPWFTTKIKIGLGRSEKYAGRFD